MPSTQKCAGHPCHDESHPSLELSQFTFHSLGGVEVTGYSLGWLDDTPRPARRAQPRLRLAVRHPVEMGGGWIQRGRHRHSRLWPLGGGRARAFALGLCADRNRVARDVRPARRGLRLPPHHATGARSLRGTDQHGV